MHKFQIYLVVRPECFSDLAITESCNQISLTTRYGANFEEFCSHEVIHHYSRSYVSLFQLVMQKVSQQ